MTHLSITVRTFFRMLALLLVAGALSQCARQPQAPPHILLIVLDTTRVDRLSCYGYDRPTTPHIDQLAANGRRYTRAYSTSTWTIPAHASLFTGLYPAAHGATQASLPLSTHAVTLAEALRERGYETLAFVENPYLETAHQFDQGFDYWYESWMHREGPQPGVNRVRHEFEQAMKNRTDDRPTFTFVNLMSAHQPYMPPGFIRERLGIDPSYECPLHYHRAHYLGEKVYSAEEIRRLSLLYDGGVCHNDHLVGALLKTLRDTGMWENTIVIITSDHGENLGEHDHFDHSFAMYDQTLHIPLVIHDPSRFEPGSVDDQPTQLVDIFPTLMAITGDAAAHPTHGIDLRQPDGRRTRVMFGEYERPYQVLKHYHVDIERIDQTPWLKYFRRLRVVRDGDTKLIWAEDGRHEAYDLSRDAEEHHNIFDSDVHDKLIQLAGQLTERYGQDRLPPPDAATPKLGPETERRLKALGYID